MTKPRKLELPDDPVYLAKMAKRMFKNIIWPTDHLACWEWDGARSHMGHGVVSYQDRNGEKRSTTPYRLLYTWWYEEPKGVLDHLCSWPPCCNPLHFEDVTVAVNNLRAESIPAYNAQAHFCKNGHALYGDNLYPVDGSNKRRCKACSDESARQWRDRVDYGYYGVGTRKFKRNGPGKTHCKNGHEWVPKNIYWRKRGHAECMVCHREREAARQQRLREAAKSD